MNPNFTGSNIASTDDKGRSGPGLPYSEHFDDTAMGYLDAMCFKVFRPEDFELVLDAEFKASGIDRNSPGRLADDDEENIRRQINGNIFEVSFDKQKRITIPRAVREELEIKDNSRVAWVGNGRHIELWQAETYFEVREFERKLREQQRRYRREHLALHTAMQQAQWNLPASPDTEDAGCAWPGRVPEKPAPDPSSTRKPDPGHGDDRK